jgi:DNA-binding transcriptional ArsR family regulator
MKNELLQNAKQAESLLKQLANKNRLMVLCSLVTGEKTVTELLGACKISQSALSQHLAKMRKAGLVSAKKNGQSVYYKIASVKAQAVLSTLYLIYCKE